MQGKLKVIPLFRRTVDSWAAATGGNLRETLELLPARVASSNLRNQLLGLIIRYEGCYIEKTGPRTFTSRQLWHMLGHASYKDCFGQMLPLMDVDLLTTMNLSEGIQSPYKNHVQLGHVTVDETEYTMDHCVILAYAPKAFSNAESKGSKWDGAMSASMLGKEAELNFDSVGMQFDANLYFTAAPTIDVSAVVLQTKELFPPNPCDLYEALVARTTDPFIQEGDARWLEHGLLVSDSIGTNAVPIILANWTSQANLQLNFDGNEIFNGRAAQISNSIALQRAIEHGFDATNGVYLQNWMQGEAVTILDSNSYEQATQGRKGKRLELRGQATVDTRYDIRLIQRRRFECPDGLLERFCEKEGIPAGQRKDIRIGGRPAKSQGLTRGEAIGVTKSVGSRKERR